MTQTSSSLKLGGAGILSSKYTGTQEITIGMQYLLAPDGQLSLNLLSCS